MLREIYFCDRKYIMHNNKGRASTSRYNSFQCILRLNKFELLVLFYFVSIHVFCSLWCFAVWLLPLNLFDNVRILLNIFIIGLQVIDFLLLQYAEVGVCACVLCVRTVSLLVRTVCVLVRTVCVLCVLRGVRTRTYAYAATYVRASQVRSFFVTKHFKNKFWQNKFLLKK